MEIMKLMPVGKNYLWGGTKLRDKFNKEINLTPLAETWECSTHPDGCSIVKSGKFTGKTLAEVLELHPEYLGNKADKMPQLPIIVKFIDAKEDLSVQVHPSDEYANVHEQQNGKTEMWYVVDTDENASLIYGFAHPVTKDILAKAMQTGTLSKHLQKMKVRKGDVYYVPAGTVHGIGAGTLVAEIQESSNVTYRMYDYERIDKDGNKRELHFDKAVEVMDMGVASYPRQKSKLVHYYPGCCKEVLCRCKYFETERIQVMKSSTFLVMAASFQVLLCLEGQGIIKAENKHVNPICFSKGDCVFIPANMGKCQVSGKVEVLKVRC